jgi:hypothetical protein
MNRFQTCLPLLMIVAANAFAADPPPEAKDAMRAVARACQPDAERLCANVEKGGGRKLMCLRSHAAELSPACKDGLAQAEAARKTTK